MENRETTPILLSMPQTDYLKFIVIQKVGKIKRASPVTSL